MSRPARFAPFALALTLTLAACPDDPKPDPGIWSTVARDLPAALLSIGGTSSTDVWAVGADPGTGPLVIHFDGQTWTQKPTGTRGAMWWVHAFKDGPVFMGGSQNTLLRYEGGAFTRMITPGVARHTVFGIWGRTPMTSTRSAASPVATASSGTGTASRGPRSRSPTCPSSHPPRPV